MSSSLGCVSLRDLPVKLATAVTEASFTRDGGSNVYRVQALPYGRWVHPNDPTKAMVIDRHVVESVVANFDGHVLDSVPVPFTHTENPVANTGYVVKAFAVRDGLDVCLAVEEAVAVEKIEKGLVGGVSLSLDFDYMDKQTGEIKGPTMLHCALVSQPYIKGMRKFSKLSAEELGELQITSSLVAADDKAASMVFLSDTSKAIPDTATGDTSMTVQELIAALKEHSIDVAKLQETDKAHASLVQQLSGLGKILGFTGAEAPAVSALSDKAKEAMAGAAELDEIREAVKSKVTLGDRTKLKDVIVANVDQQTALADRVLLLEAEKDVETLLSDNKITPAQRDEFVELRKTNKALYQKMTAKLAAGAVKLGEDGADTSHDEGPTKPGDGVKLSDTQTVSEIDRYAALSEKLKTPGLAGLIAKRKQPPTLGSRIES